VKRNTSRDKRLTYKGSNPKEKSSFSIDDKGGEKNRGMERRIRGMKTGRNNMRKRSVVSKCCYQFKRGRFLKD